MSHPAPVRLRWNTALAIAGYFVVAGYVFDAINPEAHLVTALASRVPLAQSGQGLRTDLLLGTFLLANVCAGVLAFAVMSLVRSQMLAGPLAAVPFALVGYVYAALAFVGIISVVWHAAMGAIVFVLVVLNPYVEDVHHYLRRESAFTPDSQGNTPEVQGYRGAATAVWELVKLLAQGMFAFAAITGVTMTILFKDGYQDVSVKFMAVQMATAFLLCGLALYIWLAVPLMSAVWRLHRQAEPTVPVSAPTTDGNFGNAALAAAPTATPTTTPTRTPADTPAPPKGTSGNGSGERSGSTKNGGGDQPPLAPSVDP